MAGATGWTGTRTRTAVMAIAVAYALACCCTLVGVASAAPLNVHVVPHSHNDAGWLKTVDQYYYGSQAGIDNAGVQYILDSVIAALLANPVRKFIYVEMSFMSRWWNEQNESMKADVRKLVANGQLEFISGGWCMHDEATTHYVDLIDQMSLGHKFLQDEFGIYPSTSWQVDPFGHSATHASLLTYEAGFDAMYFGRIDGDDIARRQASLETEMVWRPSESAGPGNQIFAGAMYWGYSAPDNFCFDSRCTDEPLMDDPRLAGYNVDRRVGEYVSALLGQAATTQGGEIMVMAGDDFNYHNANMYFKNLEKLMHYVNIDGRLNMFYSTPSIYTKARNDAQKGDTTGGGGLARGREQEQEQERKNQRGSIRGRKRVRDRTPHPPATEAQAGEGLTWPLKSYSDFFPYAHPSQPHAFWSGFYTSRPALKRNVRKWSGALQAGRVLAYLAGRSTGPGTGAGAGDRAGSGPSGSGRGRGRGQGQGEGQGSPGLSSLREAVALAQHHDAITGTSMQHVACDYTARLDAGWTAAEKELAQNLAGLLARPGGPSLPPDWRSCPLANVSLCPSMLPEATRGGDVALALFNGLGHDRTELVLVPVASNSSGGCSGWAVLGPEGGSIEAQVLAADPAAPGSHPDSMSCTLAFLAEVPALAGAVYFLRPVAAAAASAPRRGRDELEPEPELEQHGESEESGVGAAPEGGSGDDSGDDLVLSNEFLSLRISRQTGLITALTLLNSGGTNVTVELTQDFWAYTPHQEEVGTPATGTFNSGAYVFRPNATVPPRPVRSPSPSQRGRGWSRGRGAGAGEGRVLLSGHVGTGAVQQVVQTFAPWLHQTVRLVRGEPFLRLEWSAGPLPITGGFGMELVSRFSSNIASAGAWATDSNGRELQPRVRYSRPDYKINVTEPVAGEYYPVTSVASLEGPVGARGGEGGEGPTVQMALVVDRAQGCSSLVSGALECMLHRRLLVDDGRGVREPLNETNFMSAYPDPVRSGPGLAVRGTTFLVVATTAAARDGAKAAAAAAAEVGRAGKNGGGKRADRRKAHPRAGTAPPIMDLGVGVGEGASAIHRPLANRVHVELLQMLLPLSPQGLDAPSFAKRYSTRFGGMRAGTQLPPNVELATMEYEASPASAATAPGNANATATPAGSVLLRLAHQFGLRESPTLSLEATVDLATLFSTLPGSDGARREVRIGSVTEMSLTGTRALESMPPRLVWHVRGETEADRAGYEQQSKARHLPPRDGTVVNLQPLQVRTFNVSLVFVDEREIEIGAGREGPAQKRQQDLSLEQRIALKQREAARHARAAAEDLVALD